MSGEGTRALALASKVQAHLKLERKVLWAHVDCFYCFVLFFLMYL